jgi:hypothetical protein
MAPATGTGTSRSLTSNEKRLLSYFWNATAKGIRRSVPLQVIAFLEAEQRNTDPTDAFEITITGELVTLAKKGLITQSGGVVSGNPVYSLTQDGTVYVRDKHPRLVVYWQALLERTPALVTFLIALVGLVASILGIVQFLR